MSFLPKGELEPKDPKRPSNARIVIWVIGGGIGLYLIGSGLWGLLVH
ncbi:MAG: hypothetical protein QOD05_816 [Microbacteriaceae bacterium]|jgi:hypothetical protein|nr:hypothetical protein [Leifsonia sp.]MDQ1580041.1 hypothetical protein [Microbacteriaceae bacterium]MDQ1587463.1 hypothetical protein [Microbacteriaceae bacterium]HEV7567667.1 hypothetical protein [Microbacteriaceae bacterium]